MNRWLSISTFNPTNLLKGGNAAVAVAISSVSTLVNTVYGVSPDRKLAIGILVLLIFMDWVSGIAAARKDDTYTSQYGINVATLRTIFVLCFPALGNMLDIWLQTPGPGVIFLGLTGGLIYHYWQSMTANSYRAGWKRWIPKKIIDHVSSEIEAKGIRADEQKEQRKSKKRG